MANNWLRAIRLALLTAALAAFAAVAPAQPASRMSDKQVKALFESMDQKRDRFEDRLDGSLKRSILRGPKGEVDVGQYLDDLQTHIKDLPSRFTDRYAADREVTAVLQQASDIDAYVSRQPPTTNGASEWTALRSDLTTLAGVYGTSFPLPPGASARRLNDAEVAAAAAAIGAQADHLKGEIGKNKAMAKPDQETLKRDLEALKKKAGELRSRLSDGQPATSEMQALTELRTKVAGPLSGTGFSPAVTTALGALKSNADKLDQAFGAPPR